MKRSRRTSEQHGGEGRKAPVFNAKGIGPNALLTAAAAIVPLFIVGVASLGSLAGRKRKGPLRLPKR